MHDIATLDKRGIPGCAVISQEFQPGAEAQSRSLGFKPAVVFVPHPIQNRTQEQLADIADDVIDEILVLIGGKHSQ